MTRFARFPYVVDLRRRLRPETLLTADRRDAPSGVPPRRTVGDLVREHERRAAEAPAPAPTGAGRKARERR